jgi:hypothetical protein
MPLLRDLASLDPPLFVFGGIAETVLLDRGLGPSHADVDILIRRDEFELRTGQLGELGFYDFAVYYEPRPTRPLVLGSSRDDLAGAPCRAAFPLRTLAGTRLNGGTLPCINERSRRTDD